MHKNDIAFKVLTSNEINDFIRMTYPYYSSLFRNICHNKNLLAIGSLVNKHPAGLIFAGKSPDLTESQIYSLFVEKEHRNQGIGKKLLQQTEEIFFKNKVSKIFIKYPSNKPSTKIIDKLLNDLNWNASQVTLTIFRMENYKYVPDWVKRKLVLPDDVKIVTWSSLTDEQLDVIEDNILHDPLYPVEFSPFMDREEIETPLSFALLKNNQAIGWIISHKLNQKTCRMTMLFIRSDYEHLGWGLALLNLVINKCLKPPYNQKSIMISVAEQKHSRMKKFMQRRIYPVLPISRQIWYREKTNPDIG